jgi:hypothetical protein
MRSLANSCRYIVRAENAEKKMNRSRNKQLRKIAPRNVQSSNVAFGTRNTVYCFATFKAAAKAVNKLNRIAGMSVRLIDT